MRAMVIKCFVTIWIFARLRRSISLDKCFVTIWIFARLRLGTKTELSIFPVLLPYGFLLD